MPSSCQTTFRVPTSSIVQINCSMFNSPRAMATPETKPFALRLWATRQNAICDAYSRASRLSSTTGQNSSNPMSNPTSMICPGCGTLINTDEKRCPHCGAYNPNLWGLGPALNRLFGGRIDVLTLIPTACIALYAVSLLLDLGAALSMGGGLFGMLSPGNIPLLVLGMTHGEAPWWTVLTATYLHGSLLHILFNVLWIRQLGPDVGHFFGPARYFIIYTVAGAVGFILSNLLLGAPTVGASGAILDFLPPLLCTDATTKRR